MKNSLVAILITSFVFSCSSIQKTSHVENGSTESCSTLESEKHETDRQIRNLSSTVSCHNLLTSGYSLDKSLNLTGITRFDDTKNNIANAEELALKTESTEGPIRFNEVIDEHIRSKPEYAADLLELALRRLPYLKSEPFNLIISGGVVNTWLPVLKQEILRRGLNVEIFLFPGALSFARSDKVDAPEFFGDLKKTISSKPSIFMDDTYTNGGTAEAIRQRLVAAGGKLDGVFIVYEGGKGDPASLYKSGRMNKRQPSPGQFSKMPIKWKNIANIKSIGIELNGSMFVMGTSHLTMQAAKLISTLKEMSIEVVALKNGAPTPMPQEIISQFQLKTSTSNPDVSIGNWGATFVGINGRSSKARKYSIETCLIGSHRNWSVWPETQLEQNYFLNQLSENGIFEPIFNRPPQPQQTGHFLNVTDLRSQERERIPLENILAETDSRKRIAQLSNVKWSKASAEEKKLIIELARNTSNSFEMGAIIKIASTSNDGKLVAILENWISNWRGIDKGWQTYLRADAEKAILKIKENMKVENNHPEPNQSNVVSVPSNSDITFYKANRMLPLGSALMTSSGALSQLGIKHIIHAASGSMTKFGPGFDPTLESISLSLENSIKLALQNKIESLAVPFIGGGIFASRIGTTNQHIAAILVDTAKKYSKQIKIKFVLYGLNDFGLFAFLKDSFKADDIEILEGSITNFNLHKSVAIVNAANTEVVFGGGLSGAIGRATQNDVSINNEAQSIIDKLFNSPE